MDEVVGYLENGLWFYCPKCAPEKTIKVYKINLAPYSQTCSKCGKLIVNGAKNSLNGGPLELFKGKLDEFTMAYFKCLLWSNNLDDKYTVKDFSRETMEETERECQRFQYRAKLYIQGTVIEAGHCFWLSRNHHGAGFIDGTWAPKEGKFLLDLAHKFGERHVEIDKGIIYLIK